MDGNDARRSLARDGRAHRRPGGRIAPGRVRREWLEATGNVLGGAGLSRALPAWVGRSQIVRSSPAAEA
jgi:hypothetical protein